MASAFANDSHASSVLGRPVRIIRASEDAVREAIDHSYALAPVPEAEDLVRAVTAERKSKRKQTIQAAPGTVRHLPLKTIAVTSGKGGVGKTSVTANLGVALSQLGCLTAAIDCDFGLSNLHVALGIEPAVSLSNILLGGLDWSEAIQQGPDNLHIIAGASGAAEMTRLDYEALERGGVGYDKFFAAYDFLLVDTSAGIQQGVLSLLERADETLVVVTPDPASIQDAYLTVSALLASKPEAAIAVLVNQAESDAQARTIFARFVSFLREHRDANARLIGHIPNDPEARKSSQSRTPYMVSAPRSAAGRAMRQIAESLVSFEEDNRTTGAHWLDRLLRRAPKQSD